MKKKKQQYLSDLPFELRGQTNNRFGGHKSNRMRGLRGGTYGAAGPCRTYTRAEIEEWARKNGFDAS